MATLRRRLARLEQDFQFNRWFRTSRWLDTQTLQQLEEFIAGHGILPNLVYDPPPGSSALDKLDRKALIKLWEKEPREFRVRNSEEREFWASHGHWPEQGCGQDCTKPAYDKLRERLRTQNTNVDTEDVR
jgi:hypothetical protein